MSEIIRENILTLYKEEIPYSVFVDVREFKVRDQGSYHFNREDHTLYSLEPRPGTGTNAVTVSSVEELDQSFVRKAHLKLDDDEKEALFLRLLAAKDLCAQQVSTLQLLRNEKEFEIQNLQEEMARKFSMTADRKYRYDAATRTLLELVPVPQAKGDLSEARMEAR